MSGKFITFEGIEGCGKSTNAARLVSRLEEAGHEVLFTREPGGTVLGEQIREIVKSQSGAEPLSPEAEILLFAASRAHLVQNAIQPALEAGKVVVADRFYDSTAAYQGYARGLDPDLVRRVNGFVAGDAVPDLTILLDIEVSLGSERLRERKGLDRIESEEAAFHEKVRAGYLDIARNDQDRVKVLDASRDVEEVSADVWELVKRVL